MKKQRFIIITILLLLLFISLSFFGYFENAYKDLEALVLKWGSRGDHVFVVQDKLKRWGFYNGNIDGIYGTNTLNT